MRRTHYRKYLFLGLILFALLSLPSSLIQRARTAFFVLASPIFKQASAFVNQQADKEKALEAENHLLHIEIAKLRALLEQKTHGQLLEAQAQKLRLNAKKYEEIHFLADLSSQAVAASVIYRDPTSTSCSLWIDAGKITNTLLGKEVIKKNSPVVIGSSVVGAIDYVGKRHARVRLISDSSLQPSVRVARGFAQNRLLLEQIEPLLRTIKANPSLWPKWSTLTAELEKFKKGLSPEGETLYLAKGIVKGHSTPLWRNSHQRLIGLGFNYDFDDDSGNARELISNTLPIIREGDLLVTTGMDGVFPRDLRVATVTKVYPLQEGAYSYKIDATPIVANLDSLQTLFVLPPTGFDEPEVH